MTPPSPEDKKGLWSHFAPLFQLNEVKRPWGFLVMVALAVGLPALIGTWFGHFQLGLIASGGGLTSVYLRQTSLTHRLMTMALATFGFCTSFLLSLLAGFNPWATAVVLCFIAFWASFICRYFEVPPPGSFFFLMIACIATATPFDLTLVAERVGLLWFGCLGACALALIYSLLQKWRGEVEIATPAKPSEPQVIIIALESITLAVFVAMSYVLALWLGFEKPYWAPISCAAIMQGVSFRNVWHRKIHRIFGTTIGMGLAWLFFLLEPTPWALAFAMFALSFVIEILITRNYGLAVIFITPMTIILAEGLNPSQDVHSLIYLRLIDVILGSFVGAIGGWILYQKATFSRIECQVEKHFK